MARTFAPEGVSTHCRRGHEWTPDNTYRNPAGDRICRACRGERRATGGEAVKPKPRRAAAEKTAGPSLPTSWMRDAACRDIDPDVFFPVAEHAGTAAEAKRVCASCPVASECLAEALTIRGGAHGIWGGLTTDERRRRKRVAS